MSTNDELLFIEAIELFNISKYFECHETLEEIWMRSNPPEKLFLQSLIHFAVALYHHQRRNAVGAARQLQKGIRKMEAYVPEWRGFATSRIQQEMNRCLAIIEAGGVIDQLPSIPLHPRR